MEIWIALLTVSGTLLSVWLGGHLSNSGQKGVLKSQISWEKEKDFSTQHILRLKTYNKAIEIDGKTLIVTHAGGAYQHFDHKKYRELIRPVLFEEFHVLHQDVAEKLKDIDHLLQEMEFTGHIEQEFIQDLAIDYYALIKAIENHLKTNRESLSHLEKLTNDN